MKVGAGGTAHRWLKRLLAGFFLVLLFWQGWYVGWVLWWRHVDPGTTSFMATWLDALREKNPEAEGNAEEIGERDGVQGARSAATETYQ